MRPHAPAPPTPPPSSPNTRRTRHHPPPDHPQHPTPSPAAAHPPINTHRACTASESSEPAPHTSKPAAPSPRLFASHRRVVVKGTCRHRQRAAVNDIYSASSVPLHEAWHSDQTPLGSRSRWQQQTPNARVPGSAHVHPPTMRPTTVPITAHPPHPTPSATRPSQHPPQRRQPPHTDPTTHTERIAGESWEPAPHTSNNTSTTRTSE